MPTAGTMVAACRRQDGRPKDLVLRSCIRQLDRKTNRKFLLESMDKDRYIQLINKEIIITIAVYFNRQPCP